MLVLPENQFAVLINEAYYAEFDDEMQKHPEIRTIYIITDSEQAYREMIRPYEEKRLATSCIVIIWIISVSTLGGNDESRTISFQKKRHYRI